MKRLAATLAAIGAAGVGFLLISMSDPVSTAFVGEAVAQELQSEAAQSPDNSVPKTAPAQSRSDESDGTEVVNSTVAAESSTVEVSKPDQFGWVKSPFVIRHHNPQRAWVDQIPAIDSWKPVPQPDLAAQLKKAPKLEFEVVGPPVQRIGNSRGHVLLVPNKDGTWDALFHYYESYAGEQQVTIVDLGTGETKTRWFNSNRPEGRKEKVIAFGAWYAHGKLFWPQDATHMSWYDPEQNEIFYKSFEGPKFHGHVRFLADDQNIYFFGAMMGKDKRKTEAFVPAVFNTKTLEMTWHEPVGPGNSGVVIFYPRGCMDGDWLYSAIGKLPWKLQAYNFKTREHKLLATAPIIGDYKTTHFSFVKGGGVKGHIREPDFIEGIEDFDKESFQFWLRDGKIFARNGEIPPWSDKPAEAGPPVEHLYPRWGNIQYWPTGWTPPTPPPYFDPVSFTNTQGEVTRRYRWGGKGEWHDISFKVGTYPAATALLTEVNDQVIFSAASQYSEHSFFDLQEQRYMGSGTVGVSGYAMNATRDGFFVTGYPNSKLASYDLSRPLAPLSNPAVINSFKSHSDTHYPTAGVVGGADGRVYTAGHGAGRTRRGGGWSWYDPATGEVGGEQREFSFTSITDVDQSRYILMSGGGKLCCWDTTTHSFAYEVMPEGIDQPGYVVEALPGLVLGFATRDGKSVLYGFDPAARKVLWVKDVPVDTKSPRLPAYGGPHFFRRGPDGFVWTYFNNVLVRIDPRNAEVVPVGSGKKAFVGFAGGNLYRAGEVGLARVKGVTVPIVERQQ